MGITHVIRAEEHLPNTLRQVLIYDALGFPRPFFAHVSLILAPDKSKLSKRHGATSVGEFKSQGFLAPAMINYLSLLGWNDGTEQEVYQVDDLAAKFSLERITKSPAVFDKVKLSWMNGQHLNGLPEDQLIALVGQELVAAQVLRSVDTPFARAAIKMVAKNLELASESVGALSSLLAYPLEETIASPEAQAVMKDDFKQVVDAVLAAQASGELSAALSKGHDGYKVVDAVLAAQASGELSAALSKGHDGYKGPDVGEQLEMLALEDGDVGSGVPAY
ncbi:non-discriminatory gln-glu-trna synthetase, partial [Haematococcus lacustris]